MDRGIQVGSRTILNQGLEQSLVEVPVEGSKWNQAIQFHFIPKVKVRALSGPEFVMLILSIIS